MLSRFSEVAVCGSGVSSAIESCFLLVMQPVFFESLPALDLGAIASPNKPVAVGVATGFGSLELGVGDEENTEGLNRASMTASVSPFEGVSPREDNENPRETAEDAVEVVDELRVRVGCSEFPDALEALIRVDGFSRVGGRIGSFRPIRRWSCRSAGLKGRLT